MTSAAIVGAAQASYGRRRDDCATTQALLGEAFTLAIEQSGLQRHEVDGLAVSSFTLGPDHAVDLAWKLGLELRWIMEDTNGGASGLNMLQHAVRAVEAGDASSVVVLAGDIFHRGSFRHLVVNYNLVTQTHLAPIPHGGPNVLFAHLTRRHMELHGLVRADYGRVAMAQRTWAARNPNAVYRQPTTLEDYLAAPVVAEPLHRYDCVPVVSGADATVVRAPNEECASAGFRHCTTRTNRRETVYRPDLREWPTTSGRLRVPDPRTSTSVPCMTTIPRWS